jgi:hypothetical protein
MRFDHRRILATAMGRLRAKLKYRPVIFELMPPCFTLTELQRTVEAISGRRLHKQNFRRLVETGALVGEPELVARGYVVDEGQGDALFRDAAGVIAECIETSSVEERTDQGLIKERLRAELRRFFRKRSGRRPFVLPVIMEI